MTQPEPARRWLRPATRSSGPSGVSAFAGSDPDVVLRALDARHLVLTGVSTSGVVLSTLRQAADLDYGLTVLSDGCLDADEEVHRVLTEKVLLRQAEVATVAEWAGSLG